MRRWSSSPRMAQCRSQSRRSRRRERLRRQAVEQRTPRRDRAQRSGAPPQPDRCADRARTRIRAGPNRSRLRCSGNRRRCERVRTLIERAAPTDANVLILGENGTGKEIVAREIHRLSRRSDYPMISIDLGATGETLFEFRAVRSCQRCVHRRRQATASVGSRLPTTAPCSSTRSAICRCIFSPSC